MPVIVQGTDSLTIPVGTTAQRNATPVQGMVRYNSTLGVKEYYNGTNWISDSIASGTAVASTSGTSIDFTSIPAGVKRITVMFNGVSTSGTSNIQIQLGTGAGPTYTTTGYTSGAWMSNTNNYQSTTGLLITGAKDAVSTQYGNYMISNITSNTWVASGVVADSNAAGRQCIGGGGVALAAALTAVRITTLNGTDTFDAGSINILYE